MRITHRFAESLPRKMLALAGSIVLVGGLLAVSLVFSLSHASHVALASGQALHPFTINSPNFHDGGPLSTKQEINQFGCTGSNIAPELNWTNVPDHTKSFALLMSDYDAPLMVASTTGLSITSLEMCANWKAIIPSPKEPTTSASRDTAGHVRRQPAKPITTSSCSTPPIPRILAERALPLIR